MPNNESRPDTANALSGDARTQHLFNDLHLLTIIGRTRSYTEAARQLGLSKATVSQHISALERTAGVPLVQRSTRAVVLTAAGEQLVAETGPAFARIAHSFAAVRDLAETPRGVVRITTPVALGRQHLMPALAQFLQRFPGIHVELDLNDRLTNLVQEGFDLAIRHSAAPPDNLVAWELCGSRSLLVASRAYLTRYGTPRMPQELAQHACLLYLRGRSTPQSWTLTRTGREPVTVPIQGPVKANNSEVLRQAAQAGLGIALLPDFSAITGTPTVNDPQALLPVLPRWQVQGYFGERIYALRPWAPSVPRAVQALISHLREVFRHGFAAQPPQPEQHGT
ncbi:LysR family transcriptional regulator [Lampropedia cohaerens]|uniref:LysR family transcriptional regulator n=1 Tax=Lampropedia cohaerens TaxID=1610491 RepID=UPI000A07D6F7|nr:LysR family transcriptional regulator [Lampropedia cohaerens]